MNERAGGIARGCLLFVALAQAFSVTNAGADELPQVLILTTGGTIASRSDAPMLEGHALVQAVPELLAHARIEVEEFSVIGSSKMTPANWLGLGQRINAIFDDNEDLAGIVVTHGTDTLEETAWFLNLTVSSERPVVMVGSMRSSDEVSADGPANLLNAVRIAADPDARDRGVLVAMNEDITAARDARKSDNRRVNTFTGGAAGYLGAVDPDGVHFFGRASQPHTHRSEFDISGLDELPSVAILSDYTGLEASAVSHFARQPMDGLVVRTFAGGRMSAGMLVGLEEIANEGRPIVITSRVPTGRIVSPPDYDFPAVVAERLQDNKARILLMLALTQTRDLEEIARIFSTY